MKADESPFYLTRIECPVCTTVNEFEVIKLGAYTEEGRDSDFRPLGRRWINAKYDGISPLLYFMATCTSCFYTREFNKSFREWQQDKTFRTYRQKNIRQKHLAALAEDNGPMRRLGSSLWPTAYPHPTAINKFLLGIMDEQLNDDASDMDIGRWYLRIAWLFREHGAGSSPMPSPHARSRRQLFQALDELTAGIDQVAERIDTIHRLIESTPTSTVSAPSDDDQTAHCRQQLEGWNERLGGMHSEVRELIGHLSNITDPVMGGDGAGTAGDDDDAYGDYASYDAFLSSLRVSCPWIPTNEHEAMHLSHSHYLKAYQTDRKIEPGNAQIQVVYMVGELARRTGDWNCANEYLNHAIRLAREWMHTMRNDRNQTALARRIVDLSLEQLRSMTERSQISESPSPMDERRGM